MFCYMIRTAILRTHLLLCSYSASGGRGEAWRGKNRHTGPALAWFGPPLLFSVCFFFFPPYPPLSLASFRVYSAVLLLSYYSTHIVGSLGIGCFFPAACCAVLLLYGVAGWVGSWVCPWFRGFLSSFVFPSLWRPRAGIVRRTTSALRIAAVSHKHVLANTKRKIK